MSNYQLNQACGSSVDFACFAPRWSCRTKMQRGGLGPSAVTRGSHFSDNCSPDAIIKHFLKSTQCDNDRAPCDKRLHANRHRVVCYFWERSLSRKKHDRSRRFSTRAHGAPPYVVRLFPSDSCPQGLFNGSGRPPRRGRTGGAN